MVATDQANEWLLSFRTAGNVEESPRTYWLQYAGRESAGQGGRARTKFLPFGKTKPVTMTRDEAEAYVRRFPGVVIVHTSQAPKWPDRSGAATRRRSR